MLLIPAIDLKDGHCVRLKQGEMDDATVFSEEPAAMARHWIEQGARRTGLARTVCAVDPDDHRHPFPTASAPTNCPGRHGPQTRPVVPAPSFRLRRSPCGAPSTDGRRAVPGEAAGAVRAGHGGVVSSCALKRSYRDRLRAAAPGIVFLHLTGDRELIEGFAAQHGLVRWFGLADADRVVAVEVEWTDGTSTAVEEVGLREKIVVSY